MSTQQEQKKLIRADFTYYPTIASDDGEYLVASGYVYRKMRVNGEERLSFGRPVYQRLHYNQTLPFQIEAMESHEAIRDFLRQEALSILEDLQSGKIRADISWRFRNCLYDEAGIFKEMLQGGASIMTRDESQASQCRQMSSAFDDRFPEVMPYQKKTLVDDGDDWLL